MIGLDVTCTLTKVWSNSNHQPKSHTRISSHVRYFSKVSLGVEENCIGFKVLGGRGKLATKVSLSQGHFSRNGDFSTWYEHEGGPI
jgi:hypothetical protein